jgi:2,3-bisphosphoglycerate-independent phosphoglycerate mutase
MKYVIILPDGAADDPLPQLEGRTPLEAAKIPNMDWVSRNGRLGRVVTVPAGFTLGTDVGTLSLFGYDPGRYYSGRAPLEAAAPPPFCYAGTGIEAVERQPFCERTAAAGGLFVDPGHTLIDRVLGRA